MIRYFSIILTTFFLCSCSKLFLHPKQDLQLTPKDLGYKYKDIFIETENGKLHAWFLPSSKKAKGSVLFLHGNAGNISSHFTTAAWIINQGYHLLMPDYSGYGKSEGNPDLSTIHQDLEPVLAYLSKKKELKPIAIWGQDIGASLGMYLAANSFYRSNLCLLVAEGSLVSYQELLKKRIEGYPLLKPISTPLSTFANDTLSAKNYIEKISPLPLLMVHGTKDNIVPIKDAKELYKQALPPKEFWKIDGAQHINSFFRNAYRQKALVAYIDGFCDR